MRNITEHLTSDAADRYASLAGSTSVVHREAVGVTYWYAVPDEYPRRAADQHIDESVRWHLLMSTLDGAPCRACALPITGEGVGEYHTRCVPIEAPADPSLFEVWPA